MSKAVMGWKDHGADSGGMTIVQYVGVVICSRILTKNRTFLLIWLSEGAPDQSSACSNRLPKPLLDPMNESHGKRLFCDPLKDRGGIPTRQFLSRKEGTGNLVSFWLPLSFND
jgi:hypothetical protein